MDVYREKLETLMRDNPKLKEIRDRAFFRFFVWLFLIEVLVVALVIVLVDRTVSAVPLGIVLAGLLPLSILQPRRVFTKRYGKIAKVDIITRTGCKKGLSVSSSGRTNSSGSISKQVLVHCTVEADGGRTWSFDLPRQYEKVFEVGDSVLEMAGLAYPLDLTPQKFVLCPYCGNIMPVLGRDCVGCGEKAIYIAD